MTVETIFEATAQILEMEGEDRFSTNRIAERAGISVGSLYQYFPDKLAVLRAMARLECQRITEEVMALAAVGDLSLEARQRQAFRAYFNAFKGRLGVRRLILKHVLSTDDVLAQTLSDLISSIAGSGTMFGDTGSAGASDRPFLVTHAVVGAVRAAVLNNPKLLVTKAFEDEILRLASGQNSHHLPPGKSISTAVGN